MVTGHIIAAAAVGVRLLGYGQLSGGAASDIGRDALWGGHRRGVRGRLATEW